jgi:signal transduction histidine kinase
MVPAVPDLADQALDLELATHPAARLVHTAVESHAELARERGISLHEVEPPAALVAWCDAHRVQQLFENLPGNALKFTPAGRAVEVGTRAEGRDALLWVRDEAPGIGRENLPHVFERHWRSRPSGDHGVGLGLSIARALVERHGGRIWAEAEEGRGSTFSFTLPTAAG